MARLPSSVWFQYLTTASSAALCSLRRPQLMSLSKKYGLKANGKVSGLLRTELESDTVRRTLKWPRDCTSVS